MAELITTISLISGMILFRKINRTQLTNRVAYAMFWYSIILLVVLGLLETILGDTFGIRLILSITMLCSLIVLALRIKIPELSRFYKGNTIVLRASLLFSFVGFCFSLLYV